MLISIAQGFVNTFFVFKLTATAGMLTVFLSGQKACLGFQLCFVVSTDIVTWQQGMDYCNNLGMQSVSIETAEKHQLVMLIMHKLNGKRMFNDPSF